MSHDVVISAPRGLADSNRPALLQRTDEDFLEAVLDDCRTADGRRRLRSSIASARNQQHVLKLFQPIQRQFHVALMEAWCPRPGEPRIDPQRVESAGLVIRRVRRDGSRTRYEGWMRSNGRLRGWTPVDRTGGDYVEPDHEKRLAHGATGVANIDRALQIAARAQPDNLLDEHVVPMFIAPPDVCSDAGQTLFYGIVPTTSSEISETPVAFDDAFGDNMLPFGPTDPEFVNHLAEGLRGQFMDFPLSGEYLHPGWFEAVESTGDAKPAGMSNDHWRTLVTRSLVSPDTYKNVPSGEGRKLKRFIALLRQLAVEFDAFPETPTPESRRLRRELDGIRLSLPLKPNQFVTRTVVATNFLEQAKRILIDGTAVGAVEMPASWPSLPRSQAQALAVALSASMRKRFSDVKPRPARFDEPGAQYVLRAFVREKASGACPEKVHWSADSEPFVIAQWFEGAGAPPLQVTLPDLSDLKRLKPNVSFVLPASLQGLLTGSPKDLMEGKGAPGGAGIGWICSFSLPIITLCAFIVLNIMLGLLNLIFNWMAYIKICIPYPKKAE
jgi:hypothetical protein